MRSEASSGFWHSRLVRSIDSGNALPWLILVATACRFLMAATSPLTPQEAYYWTWSRFPDWSYFDHPPLVSHGIALTTLLLGQTVFGIKSAAVLWSLGWNLLWVRLVSSMYRNPSITFWTLLALNLTLLYELYGFGPTPDGPLLLGWIGTVWAVWRLTQTGRSKWWYAAGVFAGIACLGKYAGVLLFPVVGLYVLAVPSLRRWLRRPQPYMAMAIAALIFSPVVIWNAQHDWASLAFQSTRRVGEMSAWKPRFFVVLVVTQFLLITPYLFVLSLAALWRTLRAWLRRNIEPHELLLLLSALVPLLVFVASSFRTNAKINWLMPAWWALIVLAMAGTATLHKHVRWRGWGLATSALLLVTGMALVTIPNLPLPGDLNIWSGWKAAGVRVDQLVAAERAQGRRAFVFSPTYKTSSLLWFHRPSQEKTYAQDVMGRKALQYGYFPRKETLRGATGFLVLSDQAQSAVDLYAIRALFETVEQVDVEEVGAFGRTTRRIEIWKGTGYRGDAAPATSLVEEASP